MKENWQVHWQDYYKILQIDQSAEIEVVKAAYGKLAFKYHPDHNSTPNATEQMSLLNEALDIIRNPLKRKEYDANYQRLKYMQTTQQTTPPQQTKPYASYTRQGWEQRWNERMNNTPQGGNDSSKSKPYINSYIRVQKVSAGGCALILIGGLGTPAGLIYGIIKWFTATPKHHLIYFVPAVLFIIAFWVGVFGIFRAPSRKKTG